MAVWSQRSLLYTQHMAGKEKKNAGKKEGPALTAKNWPDAPGGNSDRFAMYLLVWHRV